MEITYLPFFFFGGGEMNSWGKQYLSFNINGHTWLKVVIIFDFLSNRPPSKGVIAKNLCDSNSISIFENVNFFYIINITFKNSTTKCVKSLKHVDSYRLRWLYTL